MRRLAQRQLSLKKKIVHTANTAVKGLKQQWRSLHEGEDRTHFYNALLQLQDKNQQSKETPFKKS